MFRDRGHDHEHDHEHVDEPTGMEQSVEELEFLRSACAAAQAGDVGNLARLLRNHKLNAIQSDGTQAGASGYTPLHYAARAGHEACVRLLLEHSADVNASTASGGATPLHRAAHQGHMSIIEMLISAGADMTCVDSDLMTPLHKAAEQGHTDAFGLLYRLGPTASEARDKRGRTPTELGKGNGFALPDCVAHAD